MSQQGMELAVEVPAERSALAKPVSSRSSWRTVVTVAGIPAACVFGLLIHNRLANHAVLLNTNTRCYSVLLIALMGMGIVAAIGSAFSGPLKRFFFERAPLLTALIVVMSLWDLITLKLGWLPILYFPGPETILQTLLDDYKMLFDSTWHSLFLLLSGYVLGAICGVITGVSIGWSHSVRYWGMPVLKVVGPIPATAWIPLALVMFPQSVMAGIALIALSVWFPTTMLSASGISNVKASYLDVAKTLGAGRKYLIFRVAIPAAMPSIFIGLFMGLGASFLTLLVAESTGVSSGLGWYIDWARNYSDYNKVFAALMIMAVFFSTIMTLLFKLRDRVLVWQKGVIKW